MVYRYLSRAGWFALSLTVLLVGGTVLGISQHRQDVAHDQLVQLGIAHYNLRLVVHARIDDVLDQRSPAITGAEDDDIARHAAFLRSLSDRAEPELGHLLSYLDSVGDPGDRGLMLSIALTLGNLEADTVSPVRAERRNAMHWHQWTLVLTGAALFALLVIEVRRPEDDY